MSYYYYDDEDRHYAFIEFVIFGTLLMLIVTLFTGCATRPYTPRERVALACAIVGNGADVAVTSYGIESGRMRELNPIYGSEPDTEALVIGKLATLGVCYVIGEIWPDSRAKVWSATAIIGGGAAAWNVYQLEK